MRASARVEVARRCGREVLVDVRSEPPVAVRAAGGRVLLVGSAAGPVGGDSLYVDVVVGPGASLSLGSVAATVVWPGPSDAVSRQAVEAQVGGGGHLVWAPEPMVAVAGCRHVATTNISLADGATCSLVEEVALGRTDEPSGDVELTWRVTRGGRPLLHHTSRLGPGQPGWGSAVVAGTHRHLLAALHVGSPPPIARPSVSSDVAFAVLALAHDAWVVLATGASRPVVLDALSGGERDLIQPNVVRGDDRERLVGGDGDSVAAL